MFGLSNIQFPLPPDSPHQSRNRKSTGDGGVLSPKEWDKAKGKAKLTQEVMKIGKKEPVVERGNENGIRKG
jgi:hypothetical protein